ncbi:DUF418 domain-containing protein, partial [Streptomyces acidicola]
APTRPTASGRMQNADALRGFALFGILVVNIAYFASGYAYFGVADPAHDSAFDNGVRTLVTLLFEMKFYLLFSFLFGYSFTIQTAAAERAGAAFRPRHFRRLTGLFLFGVLNAVLLFYGDILTTYAVLGLILYAMRGVSTRTALITAGALVGWVVLLLTALKLAGVAEIDESAAFADGRASAEGFSGGFGSVVAERLDMTGGLISALLMVQGPMALAMFLIGLVAGRHHLLADVSAHTRLLRRIQLWGFTAGLASSLALALGGSHDLAAVAIASLTGPPLAGAYAATLLRYFETARGARLMNALAPAGRMALTNYLGQQLICTLIFTGIGAGLMGDVAPLTVLGIAVTVFLCQLLFSTYWMRHHPYGAAEWALRAFSYWELPRRVRKAGHTA